MAQAFVQRRASLTQEQWETFLHVKVMAQAQLRASRCPPGRLACGIACAGRLCACQSSLHACERLRTTHGPLRTRVVVL